MHELLRMQTRADTNRPQCLKEGYRDFGNEVCTEVSGTCLFDRSQAVTHDQIHVS